MHWLFKAKGKYARQHGNSRNSQKKMEGVFL